MPFVASASGLNRRHAGSEAAILGEERRGIDVQFLNAVHGHAGAETAGRRVGDVRLVDQHGAPLFASAVHSQAAIRGACDAGEQWQHIVHGRRARG